MIKPKKHLPQGLWPIGAPQPMTASRAKLNSVRLSLSQETVLGSRELGRSTRWNPGESHTGAIRGHGTPTPWMQSHGGAKMHLDPPDGWRLVMGRKDSRSASFWSWLSSKWIYRSLACASAPYSHDPLKWPKAWALLAPQSTSVRTAGRVSGIGPCETGCVPLELDMMESWRQPAFPPCAHPKAPQGSLQRHFMSSGIVKITTLMAIMADNF